MPWWTRCPLRLPSHPVSDRTVEGAGTLANGTTAGPWRRDGQRHERCMSPCPVLPGERLAGAPGRRPAVRDERWWRTPSRAASDHDLRHLAEVRTGLDEALAAAGTPFDRVPVSLAAWSTDGI